MLFYLKLCYLTVFFSLINFYIIAIGYFDFAAGKGFVVFDNYIIGRFYIDAGRFMLFERVIYNSDIFMNCTEIFFVFRFNQYRRPL